MQFHNSLLHSPKVVYLTRWLQMITETLPQSLSISEFQIPPVSTLCCWSILTCLLRVVSHKKGWVSTRPYSLACPKNPFTSQKATFHICSIFEQAIWVDLTQGSTFLSLSTFFCHFMSQEYFMLQQYTAIFEGNHHKLFMSPPEI